MNFYIQYISLHVKFTKIIYLKKSTVISLAKKEVNICLIQLFGDFFQQLQFHKSQKNILGRNINDMEKLRKMGSTLKMSNRSVALH